MSGPRTIAFVQPTSEVGGSDIALYRLATQLDRTRFTPLVVVPREGPLTGKLRDAGVRVVVVPMMQLRPVRDPVYQLRYAATFWPSVVRLAALFRRERVALVHTNSLYCLQGPWSALLARRQHVWHIREIPDAPALPRRLLLSTADRLSSRVIAMTEAVARMFGEEGRRSDRIVVVPDGIDLSAFSLSRDGARIRRELGIPPAAPVAGFVARLDPWKGADVFVRAAAAASTHRPDAHFVVCGGELPGYEGHAAGLRQLAAELGLNGQLHFTGWTYRLDDIPDVMSALDVLVHTSVRPEPFGLVLVEAMAAGKPVVASRQGGVPEVVDEGRTGILVDAGDWRAVAAATLDLMNNAVHAGRLGAAGRARAEARFDVRAYARRIETLYGEVLAASTEAP